MLPVLVAGVTVEAAEPWRFTPHVGATQIYTDNLYLDADDDARHEHVTQADVGFNLEREGARAQARLAYNLQGLTYWREEHSTSHHQLSGDGGVDLVPERLFLDGAVSYGQRLTNRRAGVAQDNVNLTDNRSDTFTLRLQPTWRQPFGEHATLQLRHTHDRVDYREQELGGVDSWSDRSEATLASGSRFSRLGWRLHLERTETEFDDGSAVTFRTAEALLRLSLTSRLSLFAAAGEEENDFVQDPARARPDDTFWRAGATWRPGTRTTMEGFYGERYFGETYGGTLAHRFRHSRVNLSYTEELTTVNQFEMRRIVVPVVDESGAPLLVDGEPLLVAIEYPDIESGVYLSRRFSAGLSGERRKTGWSLRLFDERREYEIDDQRERVQGVVASVAWRAAPRTRLLLGGTLEETGYREDGREDHYNTVTAGLLRDLSPRSTGALQYRHVERDSNRSKHDYQENRIIATWRARF